MIRSKPGLLVAGAQSRCQFALTAIQIAQQMHCAAGGHSRSTTLNSGSSRDLLLLSASSSSKYGHRIENGWGWAECDWGVSGREGER